MENQTNILIVAGEASGDLHASNLIREIKRINPQIKFFGLGGKKLKNIGVDIYFDIVELAVVGIFEVFKNLKKIKTIFNGLLKEADRIKPDLAILVDYPGFNLRLAKELKKRNIPIIYYISPQVWAWGKNRIKILKRLVERIIVVFKFEEDIYRQHNVPVSFVGHPLLDIVKPKVLKEELFEQLKLKSDFLTIALLPGSREKEVKTLLPIMLDTAGLIYKEIGNKLQFLILRSSTVKAEVFEQIVSCYQKLVLTIISDQTYDGISASDFALVASGTATLETAILGIPMAILYKVSFPTWAYLKMAIKIPYIGLVNIVREKKIIEEFIQFNASPKKIANYVIGVLKNKSQYEQIKQNLFEIKALLGEKGASEKAARIILDFLDKDIL